MTKVNSNSDSPSDVRRLLAEHNGMRVSEINERVVYDIWNKGAELYGLYLKRVNGIRDVAEAKRIDSKIKRLESEIQKWAGWIGCKYAIFDDDLGLTAVILVPQDGWSNEIAGRGIVASYAPQVEVK